MNTWRSLAAACCCAALLPCVPARADRPDRVWPQLALPAGVQSGPVGEILTANGVPMRVRGFLSARPVDELAREMRRSLGEPVVDSRVGDKRILGRADAGFYLTVQLEPVAGGTRALVAVADLSTAMQQREQTQAFTRRWLQRLPAGSQLLSHSSARDGARFSTQLVYRNGAGAALNRQALVDLLAQDGLSLEREAQAGRAVLPGDRVLLFKGRGQEASAVVARLPDGQSGVVLNTVTTTNPQAAP